MDPNIIEGSRYVAVGILGVFANLTLVMIAVKILGMIYGKKKKPKAKAA